MARRVSVVKHDTEEVQGEGSYVVLSALKVKEIRVLRQQAKSEGEDKGAVDPFEGGLEILSAHIIDWNWVDDDGDLLPLPKDSPDVVGELTNDEAEFLSNLLTGDGESKN